MFNTLIWQPFLTKKDRISELIQALIFNKVFNQLG